MGEVRDAHPTRGRVQQEQVQIILGNEGLSKRARVRQICRASVAFGRLARTVLDATMGPSVTKQLVPHSVDHQTMSIHAVGLLLSLVICTVAAAASPPAATSLSDGSVTYRVPAKPYAVLKSGDVTAVVVDNQSADDKVLPGHRAGYNGVAALKHASQEDNLFVPTYAGLNFEHVHDGTVQDRKILFGPRNAPMELRAIDERTAELYQQASLHYGLESCTRYQLLDDGTIKMTFECIPRKDTFKDNYIGLFWASYINQPESLDIHFKGHDAEESPQSGWIRGITPSHGTLATHIATDDRRKFVHDEKFPLTLVFGMSKHRYSKPWYYGVSHGMAYVLMFRPEDEVLLTQSPSGGGNGCPAWDFQFFISDYEIDKRYQFVLRAMYVPFESPDQIERVSAPHRKALGQKL